MDNDEGCLFAVVLTVIAFVCCVVSFVQGIEKTQTKLAEQIADGTHTVEVQEFSDGTREVRIVEITDDTTD